MLRPTPVTILIASDYILCLPYFAELPAGPAT